MSRRRGNFDYNYPRLKAYLEKHGYPFCEYNNGQHFKILGPTAAVELWPSTMKYRIIESEESAQSIYYRMLDLDKNFNELDMDNLLGG